MSGFTHESAHNKSVEWYTPPEIFGALGLTFDLDPCSPGPGRSFVPALHHYTRADDGLTSPWTGTVFCNPPYGNATGAWVKKLADHGDGIALVFARPDVVWFQQQGARADVMCFIASRVRFYQGDTVTRGGTPGAGSVLLAFGRKSATALLRSRLGVCVNVVADTRLHQTEQDDRVGVRIAT